MGEPRLLKRDQLFFEDVGPGYEIPPLTKGPITIIDMAKFAAMNGDFSPVHYDNKFAETARGYPAAIVHGLQLITYLSQLLTDWIAPDGALVKFSAQVRAPALAGDTLVMQGRVTRKYAEGEKNCLECEVWGKRQDGTLITKGAAVVTLPTKG